MRTDQYEASLTSALRAKRLPKTILHSDHDGILDASLMSVAHAIGGAQQLEVTQLPEVISLYTCCQYKRGPEM